MKRNTIKLSFVLLLIAGCCSMAFAKKKRKPRIKPKALLVQVNTDTGRRGYLTRKGDLKKLEQLETSLQEARKVMIHDFTDHFTYCPVYYFYDTCIGQIKNGDYSVLMDAHLKPLGSSADVPHGDEINIAYFGMPSADYHVVPPDVAADPDGPAAKRYDKVYGPAYYGSKSNALTNGLVVLNHNMEEIRRLYIGAQRDLTAFRNHYYSYTSPQFSIDYIRSARELSTLFAVYYGKKAIVATADAK